MVKLQILHLLVVMIKGREVVPNHCKDLRLSFHVMVLKKTVYQLVAITNGKTGLISKWYEKLKLIGSSANVKKRHMHESVISRLLSYLPLARWRQCQQRRREKMGSWSERTTSERETRIFLQKPIDHYLAVRISSPVSREWQNRGISTDWLRQTTKRVPIQKEYNRIKVSNTSSFLCTKDRIAAGAEMIATTSPEELRNWLKLPTSWPAETPLFPAM